MTNNRHKGVTREKERKRETPMGKIGQHAQAAIRFSAETRSK